MNFLYGACVLLLLQVLNGAVSDPYVSTDVFRHPAARSLYEFSIDIYQRAAEESSDGNVVVSPMSIFAVLSILLPGLRGSSYSQVLDALRLSRFSNPLDAEAAMCQTVYRDNPDYKLHGANRIYADNGITIHRTFEKLAEQYHKHPVRRVDFANRPRRSRSRMNRFVQNKTNNEINELVPENGVDGLTKIYLINAISLEAPWLSVFQKRKTKERKFHVSPDETIKIPMMQTLTAKCKIVENRELNAQVLLLPLTGKQLSMVFFMPNQAGDFESFRSPGAAEQIRLSLEEFWSDLLDDQRYPVLRGCHVMLPVFNLTHKMTDLIGALRGMGVEDIFDEQAADLTGLTPRRDLCVTNADHQAVIKVDEGGVKATAATSFGFSSRMAPASATMNKPFLFMIREEQTGATLFMGKFVRPQTK